MKLSLLFVLLFGFALAANAQDGDGGEMEGADDGDMGEDQYYYLIDDGEGEGEGEEGEEGEEGLEGEDASEVEKRGFFRQGL